jgi:hypothetical protein
MRLTYGDNDGSDFKDIDPVALQAAEKLGVADSGRLTAYATPA